MAEPAPGTPGEGARGEGEGLLQSLQALLKDLPGLVSDRVELLSLELQRAGRALAQIVALVVAAAILAVTAWLLLWAGIVGVLVAAGLRPWAALALALVLNLGACWLALRRLQALVPLLKLPATRRHLTISPSPNPTAHEDRTVVGQPSAQ